MSRMLAIINNKQACEYLFPGGIIRIFTNPYRTIPVNLPEIVSDSNFIFCTTETPDFLGDVNHERIRLFTIGSYHQCKLGLAYQIDVFGTKGEDFKFHLTEHFKKIEIMSTVKGLSFGIFTPTNMDVRYVESEMEAICVSVMENLFTVLIQPSRL